jgi:tRNA(fMet)-specific endonuclease VapC
MRYMMDANTIVHLLSQGYPALTARVADTEAGAICVSSIAFAEVVWGSANGKPPILPMLNAFVTEIPVLPFDEAAARTYSKIPFKRGTFDRLIAAHALSLGLTVITRNTRDYKDVPGVQVEDWTV